uniref:Ycf39 n=1 Tax=Coccophora langsdorfii TaxID=74099 RepID=A0A1L2F1K8_9PHAE|nr:Ycf39 [Coccophora langsdorfii]ANS72219.1 Ycf39 [Coccophora langsdorfii]
MTLLILGGTGTLGRQIVRKALENGFQVRCIVRNKRAANFLKEWGAELVYGDLTLPETLPPAFQGVTAIIDAATTKVAEENNNSSIITVDWYGKLIIIELSKLINIKRFIFLSILNSEKYPYITLMKMKYRVEKLIKSSGLIFTIFKYAGFFQSLINQYALPLLEQKPILMTSKSPAIAYIDTQDAAYFCIKSLSIKEAQNKVFATGSSRAWKSEEIIDLCENFSGQKAKTLMFSILFFKIFRQITGFFDWSFQISERLAFIEVINNTPNFKASIQYTYSILDINPREILELDVYFQEYFEIMLKTLEEIKKTKASIIAT